VHHPHKLYLQEPEQELKLKLQPQLCRSGWRHANPPPRPATNGNPTAIPRPPHDTKYHAHAHQTPGVAPVLITSNFPGFFENEPAPRFRNNNRQSNYVSVYHAGSQAKEVRGGLEKGKTESYVDVEAHATASRLAGHPTGISFAYVFMRVCVGILFACIFRGSSPSQLMNRQSPRRYAINRLGNRSENRSTRLTPTKTRVGGFLVRILVLVGAPRARTGPFFCLPGRGGHLGGPATKWGGRWRPAGHAAVPPAVRR
jgi:hypothetical protein